MNSLNMDTLPDSHVPTLDQTFWLIGNYAHDPVHDERAAARRLIDAGITLGEWRSLENPGSAGTQDKIDALIWRVE